jgi:hypothetical protein
MQYLFYPPDFDKLLWVREGLNLLIQYGCIAEYRRMQCTKPVGMAGKKVFVRKALWKMSNWKTIKGMAQKNLQESTT